MAWTLIDSLNAPTGGAFTFSSLTLTSYDCVKILLLGAKVTTDGTDIKLTFYVGGVEITASYRWANQSIASSASAQTDANASTSSILLCSDNSNFDTGNASTKSFGAEVTVDAPASTSLYKKAFVRSWSIGPTGSLISNSGAGLLENAGAINGLKISGTSSLTAGKVRILGL